MAAIIFVTMLFLRALHRENLREDTGARKAPFYKLQL